MLPTRAIYVAFSKNVLGRTHDEARRFTYAHDSSVSEKVLHLDRHCSGMVNPRVIAAAGLDPDEWQGFAFGVGVDRLAMLKYGMDDLRAFFDGDQRWLDHYGFTAFDQPTLSAGVGAKA